MIDRRAAYLFGGGVRPSQYQAVITAQAATHLWMLDETSGTTAEDSIGAADGTLGGTAVFRAPGTLVGHTAVAFGALGWVACPVLNFADAGSSVSFWVRQVPGGPTRYMIGKGADQPNVDIFTPDFLLANIGGPPIANAPDLDAAWHHVAYVHRGPLAADQELWVDGVNATIAPAAAVFVANADPLVIGARLDNGADSLVNGYMQGVAVWLAHALTPAEIAAQFAAR